MAQFKPKTTFAGVKGRPKFVIAGADWARIEAAYGHPLALTERRKIRAATREYLDWAHLEGHAATSSETVSRIQSIKSAAHMFREAMLKCPPKIGREADYYARALICTHMQLGNFEGRDGLQNLALKIEKDIVEGCDLAFAQLRREQDSGFRNGEMWESWVRKLKSILSKNGLPTGARKDRDKAKVDEPSPFVSFMRELQACVPKAYRRSQASGRDSAANIALSTAIVRAGTRRVTNPSPIPVE